MQQFQMRVKKWGSSAAKRLNNSRVVSIFIQSICAGEKMGGTVDFHPVCHAQPFCKPAADAGRWGKKGIETFRQPT